MPELTQPAQSAWNSTPPPGYNPVQVKDYHAGYSEGWHRYHYGAACAETPSAAYSAGFHTGNAHSRESDA